MAKEYRSEKQHGVNYEYIISLRGSPILPPDKTKCNDKSAVCQINVDSPSTGRMIGEIGNMEYVMTGLFVFVECGNLVNEMVERKTKSKYRIVAILFCY